MTNQLESYINLFSGLAPWQGNVPSGYIVDFLGSLTDGEFRAMWGIDPKKVGGGHEATSLPVLSWGEGWFEAVNWYEAAREAKGRYTMITLGACYGAQAVGAYKMLQAINPMPARLVTVEADPENQEWIKRHFRDNGLDPDEHWLLNLALGADNEPVLFPVGAPGSGAANCVSTNEELSRDIYARQLSSSGRAGAILANLIRTGSTGIQKSLVPGYDFNAEIKFVSAATLPDVLGPFDLVDYLESDIQQSEIVVFPPYMAMLKKKVRRIHIGTHGRDVHDTLAGLFRKDGWTIVFDYPPNSEQTTPFGNFSINDGILTVRNPKL